ncbi:hypothetical protein [Tuwongella immobilis]|uniref:Sialidase domain-containing protein n=1 Tax=Tuwongella immobilis TaxID=692036 RepID=A0A6C2YIW4_9BACT|nr:hypothetical protein [Tuwongella immobilis]VIP01480.1 Uncharacterized protein OS=Isosphaera pallida (strain ATCC 43644 / DSM 9630 / IS1B) GN=Isop_3614 PE=4 SV=1 [Tuwongella immobilis]VTR98532.1 Uncharacterized protein OS=Isosphaera pallida (strain ATCC 43644 / DSM 9630 / IS1B) GN=Isop_3614 PE=4 SV=1 [Tuwongella immobilis]
MSIAHGWSRRPVWLAVLLLGVAFGPNSGTPRGIIGGSARGESPPESPKNSPQTEVPTLVETRLLPVGERTPVVADLLRFEDGWLMAVQERLGDDDRQDRIAVLRSTDGQQWNRLSELRSPTEGSGMVGPSLLRLADGRVQLQAHILLPGIDGKLPRFGGTVQTWAWLSTDGRQWDAGTAIGRGDHPMAASTRGDAGLWSVGIGCSCGNAQTMQVMHLADGKRWQMPEKRVDSGWMPGTGAIVQSGDRVLAFVTRTLTSVDGQQRSLWRIRSQAPFREWEWDELPMALQSPRLLAIPGRNPILAANRFDGKARLQLAEVDPKTGEISERLSLPLRGSRQPVGLAWHAGMLVIVRPVIHEGTTRLEWRQIRWPG